MVYAGIARPDILHVHGIGPAIVTPLARLLGRVVVTHNGRGYDRDKWRWLGRFMLRTGERLEMNFSSARSAISVFIRDLIQQDFDRQWARTSNGVAPPRPASGTAHIDLVDLGPGHYFLKVARIAAEKRQTDLINAYSVAKPTCWGLTRVGSGECAYTKAIRTATAKHATILEGFPRGEALQQLYSYPGGFALPPSHEGLPFASLEALSYGLPVVASSIPAHLEPGLPESCGSPVGGVQVPGKRLAEAVQRHNDAERRGRRRRWVRQKHDCDRIALQTLRVYPDVMHDRTAPR